MSLYGLTPTTGTVVYHTVTGILAFVYIALFVFCAVLFVKELFRKDETND